jgi:AbrB family looped-hinge helix DNA binding protein
METTRLSSKGQVILPKPVRDAHKWAPGTEFSVEPVGDGVLLRPQKPFRARAFEEVYGCLKSGQATKTVRQMQTAVTAELKARHDRGRY